MDWGALEKDAYKDAEVIRAGTFENAHLEKSQAQHLRRMLIKMPR